MLDESAGAVPVHFRALRDFYSDETRSQYAKDLTYTVRPGDDALAALVPGWVEEGNIELGGASSKVEGKG